ncbi:putative mitochondrial protein, conserved [Orbilia ellipsospora]|uniref:Succinate dehydrogenase assembly factor 4, mitochondrial n=1 Tax=Orbilia ellipsospora TaxID=2528407 RepID=A0AAV9X3L9_9PEZI
MLTRRLFLRRVPTFQTRYISSTSPLTTPFKQTPSPPRLPKEDQEEFESLQKASLGAFSTSHLHSTEPQGEGSDISEAEVLRLNLNINPASQSQQQEVQQQHPDLLKGGEKPLFEGDRNPVTGEVGGPKTDPVKYGDWSFNGRVTDF